MTKDSIAFIRFLKENHIYMDFFVNFKRYSIRYQSFLFSLNKVEIYDLLKSPLFFTNNQIINWNGDIIDWECIAIKYENIFIKSYARKLMEIKLKKQAEKQGTVPWFNRFSKPTSYKR